MKLSELIADAERTMEEFGDIPVTVSDVGCGCCRDYIFEPAETRIEKGQKAWDGEQREIVTVPVAFVVA
ncbi:hypothetical protein [Streptomyces sp. NBC_01751]|uniref:hypothetical protein n=1 Tax=Streptomyces sp. NBC_01751 TaxID=2975929 RepID=UPI002DDBACAC|nr:hypothetical protein [Streptomyces sp. NBC_01751]WSD24516.1 hypothetical protein OHA26_14060 [Streptomyces sp. NBC_01751]